MAQLNIKPSDSALPYALEQYYAELLRLVGERGGQPVLLNNTITTLDVNEKAPFYTEGVFRQFADRKFKQSPADLGTAVQAERFSFEYERVIDIASSDIDEGLTEDVRNRIEANQREVARVTRELVAFETGISEKWAVIVQSENLKPESPAYQLRHINFLETILYADQRQVYTDDIASYTRKIDNIRSSSYSFAQKKLLQAKIELAEAYKIARPWNIYFERDFPGATVFTFADPKYRSRQLCDVSAALYPSINLVEFQKNTLEHRLISVSSTTTHEESHARTWGAAGGGSFSLFGINVGGGGGGSGESSYKSAFKSVRSFSMDFAGMEEVYTQPGLWYDPSLFSSQELKPVFDLIPGARDLEFVAVSLIIARGLSLTVEFGDVLETEEWSKRNFHGRGGVSIFGYSFGGSAGSSSYDYDLKLSEDRKKVTFTDDPKHCRLLAVRLERIYHPARVDVPERHMQFGSNASLAFQQGVLTGALSHANYQKLKIEGFSDEAIAQVLTFDNRS
ncbi:hypothetical protein [Pseudomonas sp. AP3_22 TE3818]